MLPRGPSMMSPMTSLMKHSALAITGGAGSMINPPAIG
jgi:hypothetical protein